MASGRWRAVDSTVYVADWCEPGRQMLRSVRRRCRRIQSGRDVSAPCVSQPITARLKNKPVYKEPNPVGFIRFGSCPAKPGFLKTQLEGIWGYHEFIRMCMRARTDHVTYISKK